MLSDARIELLQPEAGAQHVDLQKMKHGKGYFTSPV